MLTENDLAGQRTTADRRAAQRMPSRRKKTIDPLELAPGDFVVHEQHGVGRYVEMMQRTVGSGQQRATREYLVIEFAPSKRGQPGDRLYVPTDQLDQVTRYVGGEQPTLDKMGGGDWARRKGRARKAVRQIAAELIKLYAARQATKGHAFAADTPWQRELEDAFPFVETPDQLATIDDVKRDMERVTPMDRVVCGDVGYGKTEIAVRAAFKAVQDGKQVAILVPTTLLVQQHYATFAERYAAFPVNVAALSRFQTDKEAKATVDGLADGSVDVVIGTHRLLSGEVAFKDLGPGRRRRGAAVRRRAQGAAQAAAYRGRRADDVRDADPADAGDVDHRHPGDVDDRDAAGGAAPGADLRRRVRGGPGHRRDPARAAPRGPGLLRPQPGEHDREGGRPDPPAGARGAGHRSRTGR